jgi:hypothetical protein
MRARPRSSECTSMEPDQTEQVRERRTYIARAESDVVRLPPEARTFPNLARVLEYAVLQGDDRRVSCGWLPATGRSKRADYGVPILLPARSRGGDIRDTHRLIGAACGNKLTDADQLSTCRSTCAWSGSVLATIRRAAGGGGAQWSLTTCGRRSC